MFRGFNGFFIPKRIEQNTQNEIAVNVNDSIVNNDINVILETYTIPSSSYSASSGTINLPKNGTWLIVGSVSFGSSVNSDLYINSILVGVNKSNFAIAIGFNILVSASFSYIKSGSVDILNMQAIKIG